MDFDQLIKNAMSTKRYGHSIRVAETASKLAQAYQINQHAAYQAGLLHDYCKELPKSELVKLAIEGQLITSREDLLMPQVLHGPVAAYVLEQKGYVTDVRILQAIKYHTTGHPDMGMLAKIIFVADYIEPGRKTPGIEGMFEQAKNNIDDCIVSIVNDTITYLISGEKIMHGDMIRLRNRLLIKE